MAMLASAACLAQETVDTSQNDFHVQGAGSPKLVPYNGHPSWRGINDTGLYNFDGYGIFNDIVLKISATGTATPAGLTCNPNVTQTTCRTLSYAGSTEYANPSMAVRLDISLANYPELQPWITTGFTYHYCRWDNCGYLLGGSAPFIGAGLDIQVSKPWDLRFEINHIRYNSTDSYRYGTYPDSTKQLFAMVIYNIR